MDSTQLSEVQQALVEGFTPADIERMLTLRLGKNLQDISSRPSDMRELSMAVVMNAQRKGWLPELIMAMQDENPENPLVSSLELGTYQVVNRDIGGVSEQLNNLARQVYELRAALFGISGVDNSGVMAELKAINTRIDRVSRDVKRIDELLKSMSETMPKQLNDSSLRTFGYAIIGVTVISLIVTVIAAWGGFGG